MLFCLAQFFAEAQPFHFIYIETNNNKPFYVRYHKEIFSSTELGYLVIPKIIEDSVEVSIGFPQKYGTAIKYKLEVKQKDRGYLLKQLDTALWALYDMDQWRLVMPEEAPSFNSTLIQKKTDSFTVQLARVIRTPAIAQSILMNEREETLADYQKKIMAFESGLDKKEVTPLVKEGQPRVDSDNVWNSAQVLKGYAVKDTSGYFAGYVIKEGSGIDTISLLIPADTVGIKERSRATDAEVLALKSDWMGMKDEQSLCKVLQQKLDTVYFTVNQIKGLSEMLQTEESKLMFFKTAFPGIIDKFNFCLLRESLNKEENIIQFQKMFVNN